MPTNNPRVNVTLSPSLHALVVSLAKHQRVSKSTVLREFLEAVEPQLQQAVALMDAADRVGVEARKRMADDMQQGLEEAEHAAGIALQKAAAVTRDLVDQAEAIRGRRPARKTTSAVSVPVVAGRPSSGVTRKRSRQRKDPPPSNRGVKS